MKLAELCGQAVDYPKNGKAVDLRYNLPKMPKNAMPDWHRAEVTSAAATEYDHYVSDRALGHLYREIALCDAKEPLKDFIVASPRPAPLDDAISRTLAPLVQYVVGSSAARQATERNTQVERLYARYAREMHYICARHTLVDASQASQDVGQSQGQNLRNCLTEEEVVLGTILANCTQPRSRQSRAARMKLYVETLVEDIRSNIIAPRGSEGPGPGRSPLQFQVRLQDGLRDAWTAWCWAQHHRDEGDKLMYIESFALIALGVILDCLKQLGALPNN